MNLMVLNALLLAIQLRLDLTALIASRRAHAASAPVTTCHIHVVSLRFEGEEGQSFELGGKTYTIGRERFIELLYEGETTWNYHGRSLPLDVWPLDGFGARVIPLPRRN